MILKDITPERFKEIYGNLPGEISLEKLKERYQDFLTVGKLRASLDDYPDNARVLIERVEDHYYENNHWDVVFKKDMNWWNDENENERIRNGEYANKEEYPHLEIEKFRETTQEEQKHFMAQYHPAWCVVGFGDDKENLYIGMHY